MTIGALAGTSAFVAAVATLVGAVALGLFFSRGQPWGTWNGEDRHRVLRVTR